jgi:hypothetical protein
MATTESRTGFRLPWSGDRAPSRDGSEEYPQGEPPSGDPERSTSGTGPAGTLEPTSDPDAGTETEPVSAAVQVATPPPDDEPAAPVAPVAPVTATVAESASARRPTKFLIDLTHAMQAAAEQARAATLEQFRVEGSAYVEQIQGRSVADADALRRHADEDVSSIKEWSKAEIARIREETESRIAGRRGQLDGQLARHAALVEREVARIEGQITSFEAEMAAFFDELLAETDLTILAARAQQMPEAPAFDQPDDTAFTALMTEPGVGIPTAGPITVPEPIVVPEPAGELPATVEAVTETETAPAPPLSATGDVPFDRDAAMAAIQAAAEAAASLESATAGAAPFAEATAAELADGPPSAPDGEPPAHDPRLAMLGLAPDFAAAEAAAAEAAAAEASEIPELDEEDLVARLAGLVRPSTPGSVADAPPAAPAVSTQVIVAGLVSVSSIASFKRYLSRQAGVHHVGVSSGPDGEFLFTVQHQAEVSLRDVIPALPGFGARVTGGGDGVMTVSAHDPED